MFRIVVPLIWLALMMIGSDCWAASVSPEQGPIRELLLDDSFKPVNNPCQGGCKWTQSYQGGTEGRTSMVTLTIFDVSNPEVLARLLSAPAHVLSAPEKRQLEEVSDAWLLRYAAERGTPETKPVNGKQLLLNAFSQSERAMIALPDGKRGCIAMVQCFAHAFTVQGHELTDIALSLTGPKITETDVPVAAKEFKKILTEARWR